MTIFFWKSDFKNYYYNLIKAAENTNLYSGNGAKMIYTESLITQNPPDRLVIGYGFDITKSSMPGGYTAEEVKNVLVDAGISSGVIENSSFYEALKRYYNGTYTNIQAEEVLKSSAAAIGLDKSICDNLFENTEKNYELRLDEKLEEVFTRLNLPRTSDLYQLIQSGAYSTERAALISLAYNNGGTGSKHLIGDKLCAAIARNNRAEAWFEIRYQSNAGSDQNGIAKRRFAESRAFGMFADPWTPTDKEARDAYAMLHAKGPGSYKTNLDYIRNYESLFGTQISAANLDYNLSGIDAVSDVEYAFWRATNYLVTTYGQGQTFAWDKIYVAASNETVVVGKLIGTETGYQGTLVIGNKEFGTKITGTAKHDILYGGAGNDVLNGGAGNDLLIGGAGSDRYELSDGYDRIVDEGPGSDVDVLYLGYHYDMKVFDDGTDLVIVKTGDGGGITRVAKGMIERLEAYDPYRDMTIRAGTDAAGLKTINGGYNAVTAESIEHVLYN